MTEANWQAGRPENRVRWELSEFKYLPSRLPHYFPAFYSQKCDPLQRNARLSERAHTPTPDAACAYVHTQQPTAPLCAHTQWRHVPSCGQTHQGGHRSGAAHTPAKRWRHVGALVWLARHLVWPTHRGSTHRGSTHCGSSPNQTEAGQRSGDEHVQNGGGATS
eukprot:351237-Chlamydomonas_euryale.AAC.1